MNRLTIIQSFAAALALAIGLSGASKVHAGNRPIVDWKFMGKDAQLTSGNSYTMYNIHDKESIRHGERKWGINLVWDKSTTLGNIRVESKTKGAIRSGDLVAIHVDKGGYLKYQKRDYGINLVWSRTPVYEFQIVYGNKGTPVKTGAPVALFNIVEKDFMIYDERPVGINLRWWKDQDKPGTVFEAVVDKVKSVVVKEVINYLTSGHYDDIASLLGKKS